MGHTFKLNRYTLILGCFLTCSGILSCGRTEKTVENPIVEIRDLSGSYQIYRNGEPYYIQGVAGATRLNLAAAYGANSVRTWNTEQAQEILDEAHELGMTVTLGLGIGKEYWGYEFDYWDQSAVDARLEELKLIVERYKDHPALLMWGAGNEVHLHGGQKWMVLRFINQVARMIKETDPNHPVMTTFPTGPDVDKLGALRLLSPNIDVLGLNAFVALPDVAEKIRGTLGWGKPYFLSEWAIPGPWEAGSTEWGAKRELSSSEKAGEVYKYWWYAKQDSSLCLGGYAFYWGQKYEGTHTYVSLLLEDSVTTQYAEMLHEIWRGPYQGNWTPRIDSLTLNPSGNMDNLYLPLDSQFEATAFARDPDLDSLTYRWEIRKEGTSVFKEGPYGYNHYYLLDSLVENKLYFKTPKEEGGFRLFVYVYDGQSHVATQNIPFYVLNSTVSATALNSSK